MTETLKTDLINLAGETISNSNEFGVEWNLAGDDYKTMIIMSPLNARIQVLSLEAENYSKWKEDMLQLASLNGYGKIWFKTKKDQLQGLVDLGFSEEGVIRGYFQGKEDAFIVACYPSSDRQIREYIDDEDRSLEMAQENITPVSPGVVPSLPPGYVSRLFREGDEVKLAGLYSVVFPTYPYPIDDPAYLLETAKSHVSYRLIFNETGKLVAAASAETQPEYLNAEMTDFATLPSERGKGLGLYLLQQLHEDAAKRFGTECFYTIARIAMPGMIRIFLKCGYSITGILVNNCSISGQFETMVLLVRERV